jgi:hypothetical protein
VGKDLKQGYWIVDVLKEGVTTEFFTKDMPDVPSVVCGVSSGSVKRSLRNFLNKAEFVAKSISEGTGASIQEGLIGKRSRMYCKKVVSSRLKRREQQSAMVLDKPVVNGTVSWYLWERRDWANRCNRYAVGPFDVADPLVIQATAGALSDARLMC